MPSDIRGFFKPISGGSKLKSSQEKPDLTPKKGPSRKRRAVLDSEDEAEDEEEKLKPTPKKTALKTSARSAQKDEGAEPTSASTYFAATGKNKVNRTIPVRESKSKSKPKPKVVVTPPSKKKAYVDVHDNDPADDIFVEEYKKQSDDYHDDPNDEDMDGFLVPDEDLRPKQRSGNSMKKRKQVVSDDDEYDVPSKGKPPKATAKTPRAPPKKKQEVVDNSEAQKIHDAVPTVRVPSPVVQDDSKKFNFRDVVRRPGPVAEGSKDLPTGEENCLAGLTFVFTGILQSLSREDGQQLVKKYGGKVTTAPSRKTSYVVLGSDAGPKKLETIRAQNIKTIDEDGLFQLIRSLPANGGDGKAAKEFEAKKALEEKKIREMAAEMERVAKADAIKAEEQGAPSKDVSQLWTVKYAPTSMAQICGNKGQVEKLQRWLRAWPKNLKTKFQLRGADGSGGYRAAMIHGAPGIGKTTAAHLVAKLEGYDILEYNASDTRSKKLMEETMRGVLDNSSLMGYFAPEKSKVDASKKKLVLIMDEVDGMSAGDRGGVGQLAMLCRKTSVPIVCICNERRLPKMKPFDNITLDLPFRRPEVSAIRSRLASIAFREKMSLPANVIDQLVEGTRSDIRQVINMLSTFKTTASTMSFDESKDFTKSWEKHITYKPWDIAMKMLGMEMFGATSKKTINDKLEIYFSDHEFSYLMVQENYLKNKPDRANTYNGNERNLKTLELADNAAQSISDGDLADTLIHGNQQQWSLMPVHGMLSTVIPASYMYGTGGGQMPFTTWLGNNSKQTKFARLLKEIQSHIRIRASGDRPEVRQSYIPSLHNSLVRRLEADGKDALPEIIELMDYYYLTKEDWDSIVELGVGPMSEDKISIPSAVKSAFTRTYNQQSHPMPFIKASPVGAIRASKKDAPDIEDAIVESEDEGADVAEATKSDEDDADISKDKYVQKPKKKKVTKGKGKALTGDDSAKKSTAKGKGKATGRGKKVS